MTEFFNIYKNIKISDTHVNATTPIGCPSRTVLDKIFNVDITLGDVLRLNDGKWLNDELINY